MTKDEYQDYLQSARWKELRTNAIFLNPKCRHCSIPRWLALVAYGQDLNVHHVTYESIFTEYEASSLVPLCRRCHDIEHFGTSEQVAPPSSKCLACEKVFWGDGSTICEGCWAITNWERKMEILDSHRDDPSLATTVAEFSAIYAAQSARRKAAWPTSEALGAWVKAAANQIKLAAEVREQASEVPHV
jgi:hypothetical protein